MVFGCSMLGFWLEKIEDHSLKHPSVEPKKYITKLDKLQKDDDKSDETKLKSYLVNVTFCRIIPKFVCKLHMTFHSFSISQKQYKQIPTVVIHSLFESSSGCSAEPDEQQRESVRAHVTLQSESKQDVSESRSSR